VFVTLIETPSSDRRKEKNIIVTTHLDKTPALAGVLFSSTLFFLDAIQRLSYIQSAKENLFFEPTFGDIFKGDCHE